MKVERHHANVIADAKESDEAPQSHKRNGRLVFPKPTGDFEETSDDTHTETHEKE